MMKVRFSGNPICKVADIVLIQFNGSRKYSYSRCNCVKRENDASYLSKKVCNIILSLKDLSHERNNNECENDSSLSHSLFNFISARKYKPVMELWGKVDFPTSERIHEAFIDSFVCSAYRTKQYRKAIEILDFAMKRGETPSSLSAFIFFHSCRRCGPNEANWLKSIEILDQIRTLGIDEPSHYEAAIAISCLNDKWRTSLEIVHKLWKKGHKLSIPTAKSIILCLCRNSSSINTYTPLVGAMWIFRQQKEEGEHVSQVVFKNLLLKLCEANRADEFDEVWKALQSAAKEGGGKVVISEELLALESEITVLNLGHGLSLEEMGERGGDKDPQSIRCARLKGLIRGGHLEQARELFL